METEVTTWASVTPGDRVVLQGRPLTVERLGLTTNDGTRAIRFAGNPTVYRRQVTENVDRVLPDLSFADALANLSATFDVEPVVYTWSPGDPPIPGVGIAELQMAACRAVIRQTGKTCGHERCERGW